MRKTLCSIVMAAAVLLSVGCGGADDAVANKDFLRTADVTVEGETTQAVIRIEANCPWTLVANESWLSLATTSGNGNAEVAVGMSVNPSSTAERTATVSLRSQGGVSTQLTVRQGSSLEYVSVVPAELAFAADAHSAPEVTVSSNAHWRAMDVPEWVTLSAAEGDGDVRMSVSVSWNTSLQERSGVLSFVGDAGTTATLSLRQEAGRLPEMGSFDCTVADDGQVLGMAGFMGSMFPVREYGVCYAETENPTTADLKIVAGSGAPASGTFSVVLTELKNGTVYYARAYAVSDAGTAYSRSVSFTTLSVPQNGDKDRPQFSRKR